MEQLRKVKHSKKANMSMPLAVRVLEDHHERLLAVERMIGIEAPARSIRKPLPEPPVELPPMPDLVAPVEEAPMPDLVAPVEEAPTPPPRNDIEEVVPVADVVEVMEPVEVVIDEPSPEESAYLDELLNKLTSIQDEASLLESELMSIHQMEQEAEHDDDDAVSVSTACTEACRELLEGLPPDQVSSAQCNGCIKARAKAHKKEQKRIEKERAREAKKVKQKHKELLAMEEHDLAQRLRNLRSGMDEMYGVIDQDVKAGVIREVSALAAAYADSAV